MKKYLFALIQIFGFYHSYGQTFLNGDFENNTSSDCDYNNTDIIFNTKISNVYAFGKGFDGFNYVGEVDLMTNDCYVTPQNGNWCLGLASDTTLSSDAIAIELSSSLIIGQTYQLSFYVFSNLNFENYLNNLKIGVSNNDSTFGYLLYTAIPDTNSWKHIVFNFTALQSDKFITVTNTSGTRGWNQIDNFTISIATEISEIYPNKISIIPNPFSNSTVLQSDKVFKDAYLTIYNVSGHQVREIKSISGQTFTLFRDNLASGLYFIRLIEDDKTLMVDKLVIIDN